ICIFALSDAVPNPMPEPEPWGNGGSGAGSSGIYIISNGGSTFMCNCPGQTGFILQCCSCFFNC
ncbi:3823_t:CDS:1, partial [Ambispora gerdemannii]